jgi:hypothetical protein
MFWRNLLLAASGWKSLLQVPPQYWYLYTKEHGVTTQMTIIFSDVRNENDI